MAQGEEGQTEERSDPPRTVAYVILWIASVGLIVLDIALVRGAYLALAAWWRSNRITTTAERLDFDFMISFVDRAFLVVMVIAGLAGVVVLEHVYRKLAEQHALLRKGWKPSAILVGVGLLALLVRLVV